jgi:hypothetical protein
VPAGGQTLGQENGRGQLLSLPDSERRGQGLCRQGPAPGPGERQGSATEFTWVRSFSRPEKLPLKILTALAGLFIHTGWKKPYFFQIGQVLVVNCRVCMFPIFRRFSLYPGGEGERGMGGEGSVHCRPGRYGKERRAGPQGGYPGRTGTAGSS